MFKDSLGALAYWLNEDAVSELSSMLRLYFADMHVTGALSDALKAVMLVVS